MRKLYQYAELTLRQMEVEAVQYAHDDKLRHKVSLSDDYRNVPDLIKQRDLERTEESFETCRA